MSTLKLNTKLLKPILSLFSVIRLSLFLMLCFILGGTSQDIVRPKVALYLISLLSIGMCLNFLTQESRLWKMKSLMVILGAFFFIHVLYLIPLPPSIWSGLSGREVIAGGYELLGVSLPWLPLSVTPEKSFFSLFDFLPPLALCMMMGTFVTAKEFRFAIWCIGGFVVLSVILGLLQVSGTDLEFYVYKTTNKGSAVGFFSNANHFGVFLLMTIPIVMSLSSFSERLRDQSTKVIAFNIICILSALIGIGLSGSLGSYLLIFPVLIATYFIWSSNIEKKSAYLIGILGSFLAVFLFDMFLSGNIQQELSDKFTSLDTMTRQTMFETTYDIAKSYFPFGSGPGSFSDVYKLFEDVGRKTIPHAHNDYIEMFSEFGIIGLAWMVLAMFWVAKNIWMVVLSNRYSHKIAKYTSLAITIVLVHSIFDYSMRTISVMTFLVFCLCILSLSNHGTSLLEE